MAGHYTDARRNKPPYSVAVLLSLHDQESTCWHSDAQLLT